MYKLLPVYLTVFVLFSSILFAQNTINIPADYPTIQEGINAASDGDIVLVADGTYLENINFTGKGITVASQFLVDGDKSHIENTIIDGSQPAHIDTGSVVIFNSNEDTTSILCGFTITGGTGTRFGAFREGGGILIAETSPVIKNNIIENNEVVGSDAVWGSAISIYSAYNATTIIENNIVRNHLLQTLSGSSNCIGTINIGSSSPGKVFIRNNYIYDNVITGDYRLFGAGICLAGTNLQDFICYIENNKIIGNEIIDSPGSSIQWGGGIYLEAVNAVVRNNLIAFNSAEDGGGIYYYNNLNPPPFSQVIENNTIFGNTASVYAGALSTNQLMDIDNCIIWGNSSPQFYGSQATITWSNIEESYSNGSNNISIEPEFLDTTYFLLSETSPCIDAGNPDPMYNDVEDPNNSGYALYPAMGTLRNDIGHFGGPNSNWASGTHRYN